MLPFPALLITVVIAIPLVIVTTIAIFATVLYPPRTVRATISRLANALCALCVILALGSALIFVPWLGTLASVFLLPLDVLLLIWILSILIRSLLPYLATSTPPPKSARIPVASTPSFFAKSIIKLSALGRISVLARNKI